MKTSEKISTRFALKPHQKLSIAVAGVTLGFFFLVFFVLKPVSDWQAFVAESEALGEYVAGFGLLGPLILALLNLLLVVVALLPGHIVVMAAGYLYGLLPGFLLNHFSVLLGSAVSFYLARRYGRPLVVRLAPAEMLDRWDTAAEGYGFSFFLTCYLLPLFPADVLNFVAGLSSLRFGSFVLANALGRAWITFAITAVGTYSMEIIGLEIPPAAWILFFAVSFIVYRIWQTHFDNAKGPERQDIDRQPPVKDLEVHDGRHIGKPLSSTDAEPARSGTLDPVGRIAYRRYPPSSDAAAFRRSRRWASVDHGPGDDLAS